MSLGNKQYLAFYQRKSFEIQIASSRHFLLQTNKSKYINPIYTESKLKLNNIYLQEAQF